MLICSVCVQVDVDVVDRDDVCRYALCVQVDVDVVDRDDVC